MPGAIQVSGKAALEVRNVGGIGKDDALKSRHLVIQSCSLTVWSSVILRCSLSLAICLTVATISSSPVETRIMTKASAWPGITLGATPPLMVPMLTVEGPSKSLWEDRHGWACAKRRAKWTWHWCLILGNQSDYNKINNINNTMLDMTFNRRISFRCWYLRRLSFGNIVKHNHTFMADS